MQTTNKYWAGNRDRRHRKRKKKGKETLWEKNKQTKKKKKNNHVKEKKWEKDKMKQKENMSEMKVLEKRKSFTIASRVLEKFWHLIAAELIE